MRLSMWMAMNGGTGRVGSLLSWGLGHIGGSLHPYQVCVSLTELTPTHKIIGHLSIHWPFDSRVLADCIVSCRRIISLCRDTQKNLSM